MAIDAATLEYEKQREKLLVPYLKRLEKIDGKHYQATADLREIYDSLCAAFDGWKALLSDEREQLKAEAVSKLDPISGRLREEFLEAFAAFNADGVEPLPLTLGDLLRRFDGSTPAAPVHRVYRSDAAVVDGYGATTSRWGVSP